MSLGTYVVSQFRRPRGYLGRLAGHIMERRPSNQLRNAWTVELLKLEVDSNVLEIGCGPGLALEACLKTGNVGRVTGLDHSELMVKRALDRLKSDVKKGRCVVRHGDMSILSFETTEYDRIFSVNVIQFLPKPEDAFATILSRLKPGGLVATTYMPRMKNATAGDANRKANEMSKIMRLIGFEAIETHTLSAMPVPAICVMGRKPK